MTDFTNGLNCERLFWITCDLVHKCAARFLYTVYYLSLSGRKDGFHMKCKERIWKVWKPKNIRQAVSQNTKPPLKPNLPPLHSNRREGEGKGSVEEGGGQRRVIEFKIESLGDEDCGLTNSICASYNGPLVSLSKIAWGANLKQQRC